MPSQISIHALLAESDSDLLIVTVALDDFYPRSPCGERPLRRCPVILGRGISIHALLAESDVNGDALSSCFGNFYPRSPCGERLAGPSGSAFLYNFYPRSPCGERPHPVSVFICVIKFLSTLSLRRATLGRGEAVQRTLFLSTLSLRRATANWFDLWGWAEYFYPRSPCGERRLMI